MGVINVKKVLKETAGHPAEFAEEIGFDNNGNISIKTGKGQKTLSPVAAFSPDKCKHVSILRLLSMII